MMIKFFLLAFIFSIINNVNSLNEDKNDSNIKTLKAVFVLMRHGIRAPDQLYPTDPLNDTEKYWPRGMGELTKKGIQRLHDIGKFIKNRYGNFIPKDSRRALLRTSDVNRVLDTIGVIAKELWHPKENEYWIQPRIFSIPTPVDDVLSDKQYCPEMKNEDKKNLDAKDYKIYNQTHQDLFDFVASKSGESATWKSTSSVFNTLKSEKAAGYPLPDWVTDDVYKKMQNAADSFYGYLYGTRKSQKLYSGGFFRELVKRFNRSIENESNKRFFYFTTHDHQIGAAGVALNFPKPVSIPFAAGIIFELHQIENNNYVKVYYMNHTETLPIGATDLTTSICTDQCDKNKQFWEFENFVDSIKDLTQLDWRKDCKIEDNFDPYKAIEDYWSKTKYA